ncbi:MAG: hypothetical protein DRJ69_01375 [Thermoprotei archaeon]|nr:MAG: hypothetical protein DRJ69_01375 [Thermoprotei archaeon]
MVRLLISTLGFEEAFPIRFLMRNSPSRGDVILIVMPYSKDERSARAYFELSKFTSNYLQEVKLEKIEVPVANVHQSIVMIISKIKALNASEAVVNLSGGMRLLIIETLIAVKMVLGNRAKLELELEDRRETVSMTPSILDLKMPTQYQVDILKAMKELGVKASITSIAEVLKAPRSSIYKELKRMEKEGLVTRDETGKFTLTEWGSSWA